MMSGRQKRVALILPTVFNEAVRPSTKNQSIIPVTKKKHNKHSQRVISKT